MITPNSYREARPPAEELIRGQMRLVQRLAWLYHGRVGRFVEIEDILQAGYIGLVEAAQRYAPQDDASFATYAAQRVRGAIVDMLRRNSNLSRKAVSMRQATLRARTALSNKLGREPDIVETAEALDISVAELQEWNSQFQANELASLDEIYTDHSLVFRDGTVGPERSVEIAEQKALLAEAITELTDRHALVLQLCYVEEFNVYEMAEILDVTPGRISQIKKAALSRLREIMDAKMGDKESG
ncbi:MAG: sigma-70 family RNA polymerase sigma factor [Pseudomonadota bacterium]